jgi:hypothetical protein
MRAGMRELVICSVAATLSACGGGGGGGVASIPTPPTTPPPVPNPNPNPVPPPMPSGAIGLTGGPFKTFSASANLTTGVDEFHISYSSAGNIYTVSGPGVDEGRLIDTHVGSGSWMTGSTTWQTISNTSSYVTAGNSNVPQATPVVSLDWANAPYSESNLTYTSFGSWSAANAGGSFVYGTLAPVSAIPATGTATFNGDVRGYTSRDGALWGNISLQFDFAQGNLAGSLAAAVTDPSGWNVLPIAPHAFSGTVTSGAGTFSGAFNVPGSSAASSLTGTFTGPDASELMGSFLSPYLSPNDNEWGTMNGVFTGKKAP